MAHFRPPCESYFVESHDECGRQVRNDRIEQMRKTNLLTQGTIASALSQQARDEYLDDILHHMEKMESDTLPDVASIEIQTEIQWFMRPYLIDFLIEAHGAFNLLPETLFLTINLLDRYCSRRIVYKRHYQLVGCAALLIAAKYGDRKEYVPTIGELKFMCCSLYDDEMFTQMEWHVLQTLDWAIGHPTIDSFLQLALIDVPYDSEVENMARYISEIAMFSKDFISKRPSDMARSSLALARLILNRPQPVQEEWASRYDPQTLYTLSHQLHHPSSILARKYSTSKLARVSALLEGFLAQQAAVCYTTPPTPPGNARSAEVEEGTSQYGAYITPTKGSQFAYNTNGCLTPPITPVVSDFVGYNPVVGSQRRPATPSSLSHESSTRRHETQHPLPPIQPPSSVF
ncbi:hypothetical protein MMC22_011696 [Lobaria immixta]|nr:hypothetical protein [Lobaria immixta]